MRSLSKIEEIADIAAAAPKPIKTAKPKVQVTKTTKIEAKPKVDANASSTENKKRKADVIDSPAAKAEPVSTEGLSKSQKKKLAKKAKTEGSSAAASAPAATEKKGGDKQKVRK